MNEEPRPDVEAVRQILEERFEGITRQIDDWIEEARTRGEAIHRIVADALKQPFLRDGLPIPGTPGMSGETPEREALEDLAEFAREMECTIDQGKILSRLIEGACSLAPRVVLFIVKDSMLHAWNGRGVPPRFDLRAVRFAVEEDSVLGEAVRTRALVHETPDARAGNREIAGHLGEPAEMLAAPLWIRDRVAAVLYADTAGRPWYPDAIAVMTSLAALSLEALPARARYPRRAQAPSAPAVSPGVDEPSNVEDAPKDDAPQREEDARRFAKLLVSEIALYNERAIEEGRRTGDLYDRLKDDIERSRTMFQQRFRSCSSVDTLLREEMIRTLAGGDASALALPWG